MPISAMISTYQWNYELQIKLIQQFNSVIKILEKYLFIRSLVKALKQMLNIPKQNLKEKIIP